MLSSKTLKPSLMGKSCGLSSSCRRSHLDSATYRTLSRILAVFRDLSDKPQNPDPNATIISVTDVKASQLVVEKNDAAVGPQNPNPDATISSAADEDRISADTRRSENPKLDGPVEALQLVEEKIGSVEPQNPNSNDTPIPVGDEVQFCDSVKIENSNLDGTVEALQLAVEKIDTTDEVEIYVSNNNELLNSMVSDLSLLVSAPVDPMQSSFGEFAADEPMRVDKDQKLSLVSELNHHKDQNQQMEVDKISAHNIETGNDAVLDLSCREKASGEEIELSEEEKRLNCNPCNKTIEAELVENMELLPEIGEMIQLGPPNVILNLERPNQDHLNHLIEEGEITDDAQDLDDESDLDSKDEPLIDDESEKCVVHTYIDENLATKEVIPGLEHENSAAKNQGIEPNEGAHEVGKKRKRVFTEERKAKKKKAYRKNRALKLKKEGVKRLRLPLLVKKEKEKKICKFYLLGKCQQGDQCKFSHDVTPVTKSKACSHFARGECLKGDECPYDHDLSKYPCHKFVSEGMCNRGANCKFSHIVQIQKTEGASVQTKESGKDESDKSNVGKETNKSQKTSIAKCKPVDTVKHLNPYSEMSIEASRKVPKGVRFLSFEADSKKEKHSDVKPATEQKPHLVEQTLMNVPNKKRENLACETAGSCGSGELSEASKILQEFLFGALPTAL
ncbi:Zinc finger CCCH domain-containing protein 7 [Rhynchospora pubera]|uniref:Zinc finger CCCH domain-containing protein 7 n=1 Tax=Rhynchospora pubera TaxID=906938 RepID=A0AAV8C2Z9_9POAL|nr:Zinc finger CCCH domain-containing protein 7 [Rhynchospora pubera]